MNPEFLSLSLEEQAGVLQSASMAMGRDAKVLEKDVWVCWGLQQLFSIPDPKGMAFKGGTALSKVYQAITRFSEDIDVTIDYRSIDSEAPKLDTVKTSSARNQLNTDLKGGLAKYVHKVVKPYFEEQIAIQFPDDQRVEIDVDATGEKFKLQYTSALGGEFGYLRDHVLIEFGGRNTTVPSQQTIVVADMAQHVQALTFPQATVTALAAERTFWEKATLIHAENKKGNLRARYDRWSRHWYDLAQMAAQSIGTQAISQRDLLQSVVDHKKVFYYSADADYDACVNGGLCLVTDRPNLLDMLRDDYAEMVTSGMFSGDTPSFDEILDQLKVLETTINTASSV